MLLGDVIDADTADRYGLLSRRVPHGELAQTARALAVRLAEGPALAQGVTKQMLDREASLELADAVEAEARAQAACLAGDAFRAAARRFKDGA